MEDIIKVLIEQGLPALLGGGAVALFLIPEKRGSARLDNAERVLKRYEDIISRLEKSNQDKDIVIAELRTKVAGLETSLSRVNATLSGMQIQNRESSLLRCEIIRCKNRKPKANIEKLNEMAEGHIEE